MITSGPTSCVGGQRSRTPHASSNSHRLSATAVKTSAMRVSCSTVSRRCDMARGESKPSGGGIRAQRKKGDTKGKEVRGQRSGKTKAREHLHFLTSDLHPFGSVATPSTNR